MANFNIRRDALENFEASNPILAPNEIGVYLDVRNGVPTGTDKAKLGDGKTRFNDLDYWNPSGFASRSAFVADVESRNTDTQIIDDYLVFNVGVGRYAVASVLYWEFAGDPAIISLGGGTATAESALQWVGFPSTDISTPELFFTQRIEGIGTAPLFDTTNTGDVTISINGIIDVTAAGTFALKWGGTNGGEVNSLLSFSVMTLTTL